MSVMGFLRTLPAQLIAISILLKSFLTCADTTISSTLPLHHSADDISTSTHLLEERLDRRLGPQIDLVSFQRRLELLQRLRELAVVSVGDGSSFVRQDLREATVRRAARGKEGGKGRHVLGRRECRGLRR